MSKWNIDGGYLGDGLRQLGLRLERTHYYGAGWWLSLCLWRWSITVSRYHPGRLGHPYIG